MGPLQDIRETWARFLNDENAAWIFVRQRRWAILGVSLVVLVPCFWHRHIEAGDLASHVYNAWLAELIEKGQAPGLYLVPQWHNVLFDVSLLQVAKLVGLAAAERMVVSLGVLLFFWGVFALVAAVTGSPPWFLTPCLAMLAYGYSFSMGLMNYYLSLGFACFAVAILWRGRGLAWLGAALLAAFAFAAHPIGFLWLAGTVAYLRVRERIPGWRKRALPLAAAAAFCVIRGYALHRPGLRADWDRGPFYLYNGADQLVLYGKRYVVIAVVTFFLGVAWFAVDALRREGLGWKSYALPLELYAVTFCAVALLPENLHPSWSGGWIGLLGSRLTAISAVFGLCLLGLLKPRRWHLAGFGACSLVFFGFLYQDTGWLNQLEANAEHLLRGLSPGTRVLVTMAAPPESRIQFVGHSAERACIQHCFSYENYEPASGQFRVRVGTGSPLATASSDDAEDMAAGEYEVDGSDLPLQQIYQCDPSDLRKLCIRDLKAGETNGRLSVTVPPR